jgi:hypothetical protein
MGPIARPYAWVTAGMFVIDVHKVATFTVVDDDHVEGDTYTWSVDGQTITGPTFEYTFTSVGDYNVVLKKTLSTDQSVNVFVGTVKAKYVRREVRDLTETDREAFFETMKVLYSVPQAKGEDKYGSNYISMEKLVLVHLELAGDQTCDHLHDGLGFLTSHSALTNMMERSMQAVNPAVSIPYWDFSIEGQAMSDNDGDISVMENSIIFSDDWFGEMWPEDGIVSKGRWAYTEVPTVDKTQSSVYSPYGLARSPWNVNNIPYLTRFSDFYGTSFTEMGACKQHYNHMTSASLYEFVYNIMYNPHGIVHAVIGGVTNSNIYGSLRSAGAKMISADTIAATSFAYQKNMWRYGTYSCPTDCDDNNLDIDACSCSCPSLSQWKASGTLASAVNMLDPSMSSMLVSKSGDDLTEVFMDALCNVNTTINSPFIGDMLESGSPIDPLFWPMHPTIERLVQRWSMTGTRDETWVDGTSTTINGFGTGTCTGHDADDVIFYYTDAETGQTYTNSEFYQLLSPSSDNLNYVYHNFLWAHCSSEVPIDFTPDDDYTDDSARQDMLDNHEELKEE